MESKSQKSIKFIKPFWLKYEARVVIIIGFVLVAAISFEFGLIQGKKVQDKPLVIEKPALSQNTQASEASAMTIQAPKTTQEAQIDPVSSVIPVKDCAFVGSKNSTKFHVPTCSFAKRILPKNLVCFKSAEEALAQGRVGDKGCIK
ncbi:MAG: hypothetical protein WC238_03100 [Parcubacteria group bacterium]|jgi:hypothetical protein